MKMYLPKRPHAVAAVAAGALVLSMTGTAFGRDAQTTSDAADQGTEAAAPVAVAADGMLDPAASTVRLITGHQVEIGTAPDGTYQVNATSVGAGAPHASELTVRAMGTPGDEPQLIAEPLDAITLLADHRIDPQLFDLDHLIAEGFGTTATPVTLHFDDPSTAEQTAATANELPGSRLVPNSATEQRATVTVPADDGAAFWNAVTEPAIDGLDDPNAPRTLIDGVAGLTLDGAALPAPPDLEPTAEGATAPLTIRLHGHTDRSRWHDRSKAIVAPYFTLSPVATPTPGATVNLALDDFTCQDPQCLTAVATAEIPEGVWYVRGWAWDWVQGSGHLGRFTEPEVPVEAAGATLDLRMDDLAVVEWKTPRPAELFQLTITKQRTMPDGSWYADLSWSSGDRLNSALSMAPTQRPATTGAFNVMVNPILQQPRAQLSVTRPNADVALHAQYGFFPDNAPFTTEYLTADGDEFGLVDGGYGTPEDFERIDARGKLVLIGISGTVNPDGTPSEGPSCAIPYQVFERAEEAGAVAVVIDPADPFRTSGGRCNAPISNRTVYEWPTPFVTVLPAEAAALRDLLEQGPVEIAVHSPANQRLEYVYELGRHFYGGIPASIGQAFNVTADDLVVRDSRMHGTAGMGAVKGDRLIDGQAADIVLGSSPKTAQFSVLAGNQFYAIGQADEAVTLTEYIGPISHDVTWRRAWEARDVGREFSSDVFTEPSARTVDWLSVPRGFAPRLPSDENEAWSSPPYDCSFCRAGDEFYPWGEVSGSEEHQYYGVGFLGDAVLTDADGTEYPPTSKYGRPAYTLPPEPQQYTLRGTGPFGASYQWTFTSETGDDSNRPPELSCTHERIFGDPCGEPVPMVYLRHDVPVDIDNTAPAGQRHRVSVTAFHQATDAPSITRLTAQVSFDGGETWHDVRTGKPKRGSTTVSFQVPPLADTNGHVSLRTSAEDADGNTVLQTILDAYALR